MNKKEKAERRRRLEMFRKEILPKIIKNYNITSHGSKNAPDTMYKIRIKDIIYDYYPMSEKLRVMKYSPEKQKIITNWQEYKLDKLLERFKNI
jgi:hypothetical protein